MNKKVKKYNIMISIHFIKQIHKLVATIVGLPIKAIKELRKANLN